MSESPRRGGKKGRKYGRYERKPASVRYRVERRWEKNKARRAAKRQRVFAKRAAIRAARLERAA